MSDRNAPTTHPILSAIASRWSPRAFADTPIEPAKLQQVFEAASWASSAFNEQPWRFIVATKDAPFEYEKIVSCLGEFNQSWAKSAPVLMIAVASSKFERNDNPNPHAQYDTGQALATLAIQASALDLYVHQMAGFDPEKATEVFNIPADFTPMAVVALGYLGESDALPDPMRERENAPRERKPLSQFVFSGTWGETSDLVS